MNSFGPIGEGGSGAVFHPKRRKPRKNHRAGAHQGSQPNLQGGVPRGKHLTPEQRHQIAQAASKARWENQPD